MSLRTTNVNDHTEKKGQLTYLSWAWAWDIVLQHDEDASWEAKEYRTAAGNTVPCMYFPDHTAMVSVTVTIKGKAKSCVLPVMDNRNKSIVDPTSFHINTAIMRCMTKAVSMFGLGLYIYAGEDLPSIDEDEKKTVVKVKLPALAGIGDDLPQDIKTMLENLALTVTHFVNVKNDPEGALDAIYEVNPIDDEKIYLDRQLPSNVRSTLRRLRTTI